MRIQWLQHNALINLNQMMMWQGMNNNSSQYQHGTSSVGRDFSVGRNDTTMYPTSTVKQPPQCMNTHMYPTFMLQGMSHGLSETQGMSQGMYEGMSQSMLQGTLHGSNNNNSYNALFLKAIIILNRLLTLHHETIVRV